MDVTDVAHVLYGVLTALVAVKNAPLAIIMFLAFLVYEISEHLDVRDVLYKDIMEFAIGVAVGAAIVLVFLDKFLRPTMWLPP